MRLSYTKRIDLGFFVAFVLICSIALSVYACFQQMNHQKDRVEHTYTVISTLQDIMGNLADVQGSVRGYIITGREDYLAPFHMATPKVITALENLGDLVTDNSEQMGRFTSLREHVDARVQIAENAIDTYRKSGQKVAMDSIANGSGKREMDEIRVIVMEMVNEEKRLLDIRKTAVENFSSLTMLSGYGLLPHPPRIPSQNAHRILAARRCTADGTPQRGNETRQSDGRLSTRLPRTGRGI